MALNKVNYIDGQTLITAKNMNEIQDEVIRLTELIEIPSSGVVKTVNGVEPDENGNVEVEVSEDVVLYTAQTLTEQQKTQVCTNIGAQKTLNFDTTPISGSTNPVTSDGLSSKFATQDENIEMASMAASIAMPGSLKWDGIVGDRECVVIEEGPISEGMTMRQALVQVSDYFPEILILMMEGAPAEERTLSALLSVAGFTVGAEEMQVQVADDMFIMGEAFFYVPTDGYSLEGIVFPKKGWYFISVSVIMGDIELPMMYVNGLQIEGLSFPDTNGGSDKYFESIETEKVYKLLKDASDEGISDGIMSLYKVSSEVPPISVFSNGYKIIIENNGYSCEVTTNMTTEYIIKDNGTYILCATATNSGGVESPFPYIFVIPYDGYDLNGVTIPTAGMYTFATDEITLIGGNGSCEVIKTEHLPEALRFGEITTEVHGNTLTWDGNTDGLVNINNMLYRVSDAVPTLSDIHQGFSMVAYNYPETIVCSAEQASNAIVMDDNGMIGFDGFIILTVPLTEDSVTYPSGVYLINNGSTYVSSLTINGYNGFVSTETKVVKIDPKYLPDDIGGGGSGSGLPEVSADDNGKSVSVVDGEWVVKKPSYNDLSDKPTLFSGSYNDLNDKPTLFSGSYNDLTNKPTLFSGSYNDLSDKPMLDTVMSDTSTNMVQNKVIKAYIDAAIGAAIAASY